MRIEELEVSAGPQTALKTAAKEYGLTNRSVPVGPGRKKTLKYRRYWDLHAWHTDRLNWILVLWALMKEILIAILMIGVIALL
jgi:hypothetical protein